MGFTAELLKADSKKYLRMESKRSAYQTIHSVWIQCADIRQTLVDRGRHMKTAYIYLGLHR